MADLQDFPPLDILHQITDFLTTDLKTLSSLQRVCKGFHEAIAPRLWRSVEIHHPKTCTTAAGPNHFPVLDVLARNECPYGLYVKELVIDCPYVGRRGEALKNKEYVNNYNTALKRILKKCKNLEKFYLESRNDFTRYSSLEPLDDLKKIKDINIRIWPHSIPPYNSEEEWDTEIVKKYDIKETDYGFQLLIHNLTSLKIECAVADWDFAGACLAMTLGWSPNLVTLSLAIQLVEYILPEGMRSLAEYGPADMEQAWKRICTTYHRYAEREDYSGSLSKNYHRLKLRNLSLGQGFPLIKPWKREEEEGNYMEKMLDLSVLASFSYKETVLSWPNEEGYTVEDCWDLLLPATNLKALTVGRITRELKNCLINSGVLQHLQRLYIGGPGDYGNAQLWTILRTANIGETQSSLKSLTSNGRLVYRQSRTRVTSDFGSLPERFRLLEMCEFHARCCGSILPLLRLLFDAIRQLPHLKVLKFFRNPDYSSNGSPRSLLDKLKAEIEESMELDDINKFPSLKLVKLDNACYEIIKGLLQIDDSEVASVSASVGIKLGRLFREISTEQFSEKEIGLLKDEWLR